MTMQETATLTRGESAPDFLLPATDGKTYSLETFQDNPYLAVVFLANHCPYVGAWEDRIIAIANDHRDAGVAFAAISSSDATKFRQDTFERMKERAEERSYPFPYLNDEEQSSARTYGATRTPEVFLFDRDRRLRYHGAVDSDWQEEPGVVPFLRNALDQLLAGKGVDTAETAPVGCMLKLRG